MYCIYILKHCNNLQINLSCSWNSRIHLDAIILNILLLSSVDLISTLLQDIVVSGGQFYLEPDMRYDHVCRLWEKYRMALQEKELAVQAELTRLERLYRLGDKLNDECRACDMRLDALTAKVREVSSIQTNCSFKLIY